MRVVTLTVVLAAVLSVDAKQSIGTQRSVCTGVLDGTFVADDESCSNFFVCYNGEPVTQSCGRGSYFDQTQLYCLPDTNNICPQPQCSVNGAFSAHTSNCNLFYVCYQGELVEQSCGAGSYFDQTDLYCLPDTNNICPQPECNVEGAFSPHPTNCSLFYVCYDDELVEQNCGVGSYFDKDNLYCLPDTNNICPQPQCNIEGAFSPHSTNCNLFYVCFEGKLVEQSCGAGSYFDSDNLYCLPDVNNICPQSPCSVEGAFSPHATNCNLFYVCFEGKLVEQSCGAGGYFDRDNLYCLPDTNNICPQPQCNVEGAFSPHATNCNLFYVCFEGKLVEQSCGAGSYFDKDNLYCLPDTNNICPQPQCNVEGAFSPHATNCNLFYVCFEGKLVEQSCGAGSYFDKDNLYCLPDTNNICPQPQCNVEGAFSPHATNCNLFYVCFEGKLVEQSCGAGSYFDKDNLYCLPDTNNICPQPQCNVEGAFSPHATNCNLFYVCYQGELVEQSCGAGSYFDKDNLYCLPDTNNICPQPNCTVDGVFSAHPTNCNLFYVCYQGKLVEQNCGTGSYFDKTYLYCLPDTNNICPVPQCTVEGAFSPHPTECALFYVCYNGLFVEQTCGNGSYFDQTNLYCLPDTSNICWPSSPTSTAEPCTCVGGYTEGEFVASHDSCYSYYICSEGELMEQNCGYGNYFDNSTKRCERDTTGECWPLSNTTSTSTTTGPCKCTGGYEEGDLVASPDNCYSYYVCTEGELVEQNCGNGNYFDNSTKTCERDIDGECWPTSVTESTTTTESSKCQCPGGYEEGDLVANDDSCHSYFVCTQGELIAESCGTGNYFDSSSKTCVRDTNGICSQTTTSTTTTPAPCLCPGGYEEGDFVANDDSCHSYFVCTQGELIAESCGTGNYFDSSSKTCVRDTNGICWQTTTSTTTTATPCLCPGGYEEGDFVANDDSCHSYFVCTQGELVGESCGTGNYFNSGSKTCVRDTNGTCWKTTTSTTTTPAPCICPGGYEEGDFVPDDNSCHSYFVCTQGELVAESCGTGNYFDSSSKTCVRDINGTCWQTPTSTTTTPAPCLCPGGYEEGDLVANDDSCHSYFVCTQGELVAERCGTGNYFNSGSKTCVRDTNGTCWKTTTSTTTTPAPCICPGGYEEGDFVANDNSCHSYFVCTQGELVAESCGTGNYFDSSSKTCVRDTNGICWQTTTSTTTTPAPCLCPGGYEEGDFVANDDSCHSYFVCTQGELIAESCGTGNYFDSSSKTCVRDTNGICWQTTTSTTTTATPCLCPGGYEEGDFVPDDNSCHSYFVCTQGELVAESCGTGNYFDSSSKTCVRDTNSICWQTTTSTTTTPAPCLCPGGYEEGDFVANDNSCHSYFVCTQGELVAESCGTGNYFDSSSKTCVRDTNGICWQTTTSTTTTPAPCLCPGGYEEGDFVANDDSCHSYFVCTQGELVAESCGTENYFDSSSKTCVRDTNGICWQTTTTAAPCLCPGGYEEGDFVANDDSCYSYFICTQGEFVAESCGTGNYFDSGSKTCARDTNGTCWKKTTSTTTTPTPCLCSEGYEEGDFVPDDNSCHSYFVCTQGELVAESCGTGNYFDSNSKTCVRDTNGICWQTTTSTTTTATPCLCPGGYEEGDFVANDDSCHSYFVCTQGELVAESCGTGNYFDSISKTCVRDTNGICWQTTTTATPCLCPGGYEEGDFVANDDSCHSYFVCTQGELVAESCGTGNYFDSISKTCVRDTNGICWQTTTSTTTTAAPCLCPGGYEEGDFVANDDSCYSYFICTQGELVAESCGTGNYFDSSSKKCVRDINGTRWQTTTTAAPFLCPGGYDDGDFVAHPNSCFLFYICYNGVLIEETCGHGNYFDNESKSCALDRTAVCWTLSTSSSITTTLETTFSSSSSTTRPKTTTPTSSSKITTQTTPVANCSCTGGYEDGEFIQYPGSCYLFYICYNGELIEESCGNGNYFDADSKSCILDTTGVCWTTSNSTSTTSKTTPPSTKSTTTKKTTSSSTASTTTQKSTLSATTPNVTPSPSTSSITQTTPETPCTCPGGYEDGEFIPYPGSCYLFYICYNGELIEESCGNGNYFDVESKSCVLDTNGVCWTTSTSTSTTPKTTPSSTTSTTTTKGTTSSSSSSTTQTTPVAPCTCPGGYEDGEFIPYPGSCYLFYICYNGDLIEESCGNGNYFDVESKSCVLDTNGVCWTTSTSTPTSTTPKTTPSSTPYTTTTKGTTSSSSPSTTETTPVAICTCPGGYEDGEFIPYPGSCYLFYICYNGELIEESCGNGNYFDADSKSCILDTTGVCWTTSNSTSTTSKTTPPSTKSTTTKKTTSSSTASTTTQKSTLSATTPNVTPSPSTSSITQTTPETPCTCPGGYEDGEFIPYPGSCYLFYICYNGELIEESCGNGNYFDVESKSCVLDTNGVCWTTSTSTSTTPKTTPSSTTSTTTTKGTTSSSSSSTTQTTPVAPCTCPGGYEDGEFIPYPGSCYLFYICYNGDLIEESCGNGNYFDVESKSCVLDTNGVCWTTSTSTPTSTTPKTTPSSTPYTTTTKGTTSSSSPSTTETTPVAICTCPGGYEDGEFIPYPGSCYLFYICYNGELIEESCGNGNYFDVDSKSCVLDTNGVCWTTSTSTSTTPKTTPSSIPSTTTPKATNSSSSSSTTQTTAVAPCTCPGGYEDGEFIPYPGSCYLFYICYNGELIEESCGNGNYFDAESKSCVFDTTGVCWTTSNSTSTTSKTTPPSTKSTTTKKTTSSSTASTTTQKSTLSTTTPNVTPSPSTSSITQTTPETPCTCPGGYEDGEFIPYPGSCYLFYICYNGELIEESCGNGNYFDVESKSCVLDTNGVCWTTSTSTSTTPKTTPSSTTSTTTTKGTTSSSSSSTTQTTPVAPCTCPGGYEDGEFIPYPGSCYLFYICYNGDLIEESCGNGNYFDVESKSCVLDTNGVCWTTSTSTPTSTTPKTTPSSTPYTTTTKGTTSSSSPSTTETTPVAPCTCPGGYEDGEFIPYPGSCYLFYICYNGELIEESCGNGNYFDVESKSCVLDTNGVCWTTSTSTSTTPKTTPSSIPSTTTPKATNSSSFSSTTQTTAVAPCTCPGGYEDGEFIPYPGSCYLFYICYNGELIEESCGNGNYFDVVSKSCVLDTNGVCWTTSTSTSITPKTTPSSTPSKTTPKATPSTSSSSTTQTTAVAPCTCPGGYEDGEFIPYPGSCYLFYICYNGELIEESCGNGNYFDVESKGCILDTNGVCWTTSTSTPTSTTPKTTPSSTPSKTTPKATPSTSSSSTTQTTAVAPCTCPGGYEDGEFIPYPGSCYLFYICYNGELIEESCGNGNYFDVVSKSCVLDTNGVCWTTSTSTSTTPKTTPSSIPSTTTPKGTPSSSSSSTTQTTPVAPCTCPGGYEDGEFIPYPGSCYLFYICYNGELIEESCGNGNYFDVESKSCVLDTTGVCWTTSTSTSNTPKTTPSSTPSTTTPKATPSSSSSSTTQTTPVAPCTCPGGYEDGEFIPYPDSCYLFYICYNGELIEESCGNGNYFDVESKSCVLDTNGVCWTTSTSTSTTPKTTPSSIPSTTTPKGTPSSSSSSTTQTKPVAPCTCPGGYEDGEFIPYPDSCYLFYICYNGELIEESCGNGTYFDVESKSCVLDTTGVCWTTSTSTSTTPKTTPSSTPSTTTPKGTPSSSSSSTTQTTPVAPCTCPGGYEDGEFIPYPGSCYLFYVCYNGELIEESCGNGNYFDAESKSCVLDTTGVCWTTSTSTSTTPKTTPSSTPSTTTPKATTSSSSSSTTQTTPVAPCTCPGGYEDGEFIPYPGSCYLFYICYIGELIEQSCGNGNYFDAESKNCVLDTTGVCWTTSTSTSTTHKTTPSSTPSTTTPKGTPSSSSSSITQTTPVAPCTCPGGYEDGEFIPYPGSCYLFYICYNGELIEESCGNGNYFDVESKSCVLDTTGVCWTTSTSTSTTPKTTPSSTPSTTTPKGTPSSSSSSTTQTTPVAPCTCPGGYEDGEFIPYPGSCYLFYICYNGELIEESCGNGNYFDAESKSCVFDTTGVCWTTSTSTSTTHKTTPSSTPSTTTPKATTSSSSSSATQTTPVAPCTCPGGYEDGEFIPYPGSCYLFYICYSGELIEQSCGNGNYFDAESKSCILDTTGVCWTTSTSTSTTHKTTPSSTPSTTTPKATPSSSSSSTTQITPVAPCTCTGGYEDGEFIPYAGSCYLFYICYSGELIEQSCGNGNYFDAESKNCVLDTTGVCWTTSTSTSTTPKTTSSSTPPTTTPKATPSSSSSSTTETAPVSPCTCTGGYEDGEFIPYPGSCYLFYICYSGELIEQSCGNGNYFDAESKSCVLDTTGACWTTSTSTSTTPKTTPSSTPSTTTPKATPSSSSSSTTLTTPVAPITCPGGYEDGEFIPYPGSCYLFYICYSGELIEQSCGNGNYFDAESKSCVLDTTGACWTTSTSTSTTPKTTPSSTPSTTTPKATPSSSSSSTTLTTPVAPITCPGGYEDGEFIPYPGSCYLFYICYSGELIEQTCGNGNYFDAVSKICVLDTTGVCPPESDSTSTTPKTTPSSTPSTTTPKATPSSSSSSTTLTTPVAPITCPGGYEDGDFIPYPGSCYLFYICYSGELIEQTCGNGNYFDAVSKICVLDTTGVCPPESDSTSTTPKTTPSSTPSTTTPALNECRNGLEEGQFTAHPSSCYLFYICYGGELVQQNCGIGNYFNNNTDICEPDTVGRCWPKPTTCPGGYKTGEFVPDSVQCDKFFICNDGVLVSQDCGVGYFFDIDNKYCTRDINGMCWAVGVPNNTCEGVADGTFVPNEASCDKFFICYNNKKVLQECGVGNLFNSAILACTRDSYGTCWKKIPNVCANTITGTFVPNPYNCQEFYVCHRNRAVLQQCGNGNWFNPTLMICQPDLNATCVNVCLGTTGYTNIAHPNCNQFYRCVNGLTADVGICPSGTNFDITDRICTASAICEADLCSKSTNGAVYPVQNDVTSFYTCYNQIPVKLNCPDGSAFDSKLLVCTPDNGLCIGQENGHVVASYKNPNAFYVCKDNMAIFQQCPSYAIFDEKKNICVHAQRKRLANNICSAEPNGTMLPGNACNKFHLCLDGENIEQNCGAYSSFNQKLSYCVFNLSCYNQNEICAKSSDIEKFPDARYETSFIKCKRGLAVMEKCPKNMIYSHDIGYCVLRDLAMTKDELDELCDNVTDNTMVSALDCRKFYICHNRKAILQQCAIDQYFDVKTGKCQPDVERQCWMRSETLRRSFHLKTVCHEDQIRAFPSDCEQFEMCTYGVWKREACPTNHYFDSTQKGCIPGNSGIMCPSARSVIECFDDMPLRASEKLCTDYYSCEKSQWKLKKCPVGEFFNSKMATCTKDASACVREPEIRSTENNRCTLNETRADDVNCGLFHICYEGEWWYRHCEEGAYFNKSMEACVPNDGTCHKTGPCKNGTAMKSDFDPCITYHLCTDGNWTIQHCPTGHHFNESHKACMLDYDDSPCKVELNNVTSTCVEGNRRYKPLNCTTFEICSLDKWQTVACQTGYYFDISLELCIINRGECSANGLMRRHCIDNTSRPNQSNCREFYYCSRNEWHLESCLEGFQYNSTIDKCISKNSTCDVRDQSNWSLGKCVGVKSGSYIPHETDCTKYYICLNGEAVEAKCSYGKFYDKDSKLCQLNDGACRLRNQADANICESKPNGSQVQNPANCTTFYICADEMPLLSYCSPGLYFNSNIGACQTDTGICNKPRLCDDNPGGHLPHETYCNIYYACVRGVAIPVACEDDQIFDPMTKKCTADVGRRCIDGILVGDEICAKAENGVPLVDSDDCTKYIMCSNGLAQTLQCPRGQFFDSSLMFCMPDDGSCPYVDGPDVPNNSNIPPDPISCIGKHGDLMPDPEHCNEFYICIYGNLRHDRCFDEEFFDINTYSCTKQFADEKCSTTAEMSTLCATSEDGTNFADQTDCRKYYQCNDAELQSKKCRTGESFDTLLGFCRQNDGTCLLENGQRVGACAGRHGKLVPNSENCRGYFTCVNGQKISDECENGEYFDKLTSACEKDVNNTCRPVEDEFTNTTQLSCVGLTELVFYPNILDDCKTFFQCVKGSPRVHKCPDDLLFNGESGICDWKDYVKCIDMTQYHQKDELCVNANNGTRYGNTEDNCDSYFICTEGKLKNFKCDQGFKYNTQLEKCDLAGNVNCTTTV